MRSVPAVLLFFIALGHQALRKVIIVCIFKNNRFIMADYKFDRMALGTDLYRRTWGTKKRR